MLEMIEVVGVSGAGFSEAVKDAVAQVAAKGRVLHFFQVIEQRGSIKGQEIREYQVVVKIACEAR